MANGKQHTRKELESLIRSIDLGAPVAEQDTMLYEARVETPTFQNLLSDRVDIIPGTKGSGKTALYRLVSDFLAAILLTSRRIVILKGVEASGDPVFTVFKDKFDKLSETDFDNFWRVYFIALIQENFLKNPRFKSYLASAKKEREEFLERCRAAHIPELPKARTLPQIVQWVLNAIETLKIGTATVTEEGVEYSLFQIDPSKTERKKDEKQPDAPPIFLTDIHAALEKLLVKVNLHIWILLDRLDEVFPRRSDTERYALRALLKTVRNFPTPRIRIKVFLRDDIFENILTGGEGFTALSHLVARKSETLQWSPDEIRLLIIKRIALSKTAREFYNITQDRITESDQKYQNEVFYKIFPAQVVRGPRQSKTLRWIYHHCQDGRGVVTARDVIDLLRFAMEAQLHYLSRGETLEPYLAGPQSLTDAFDRLSAQKRGAYLEAEFPHFWPNIRKFENRRGEHNETSLAKLLGSNWKEIVEHLVSIGFLRKQSSGGIYSIPFLFRPGMHIRQGKAF